MNAVDTNVILYSIDDNEPVKKAKAQHLLQQLLAGSEPAYLLWQVLGELVNQLRRWKNLGQLTDSEFDNHVRIFRNKFPLIIPSPLVVDHALDLAKRYSLSHWDSMILGACKAAGITMLHTEDMGAPTMIDTIQLANPFV